MKCNGTCTKNKKVITIRNKMKNKNKNGLNKIHDVVLWLSSINYGE